MPGLRRQLLLVASLVGCKVATALELTPENWDATTGGKKVFIKFYAPWCGHCKKLKPDWDKLTADFEGSKTALIADVDCTKKGKELCEKHGVKGFPSLQYGSPGSLQVYNGPRNYQAFRTFVEETLGAESCGPENVDLCTEKKKELMEKFMKMAPNKLALKVQRAEEEIKKLESEFMDVAFEASAKIDKGEMEKEKKLKKLKDEGLELMKMVQKYRAGGGAGPTGAAQEL